MEPNRILPDLQCSLMCEQIRQEANGNFFLIGIISHISIPKLPVGVAILCVFNRWTAGIGKFQEQVRLMAPDGETIVSEVKGAFELQNANLNHTSVSVFRQIEIKFDGIYFMEVAVDDVLKLRYPVPVVVPEQLPSAGKPENQ